MHGILGKAKNKQIWTRTYINKMSFKLVWRNGRRTGLKIPRWQHRVGSTPTTSTKSQSALYAVFAFAKSQLTLDCSFSPQMHMAFAWSPNSLSLKCGGISPVSEAYVTSLLFFCTRQLIKTIYLF